MPEPIMAAGYVEQEPDFIERWCWYDTANGFLSAGTSTHRGLKGSHPTQILIRVMIPTSQIRKALSEQ